MHPAHRTRPRALAWLLAVVVATALVGAVGSAAAGGPGSTRDRGSGTAGTLTPVDQSRPGPVLLVPGYGGNTVGLQALARRLAAAGHRTVVVDLPGDGTGDLQDSALRLRRVADDALAAGAPSVDVVGYSAGGVVARLWARDGGAAQARRIITLGSPHHGTAVDQLGAVYADGACPSACRQLVPGSPLLTALDAGDETPDGPQWMSIWSSGDSVVRPPDSARLRGAVDVAVQQVCPGARLDHGRLPHDLTVQAVLLQALSAEPVRRPGPEVCAQGPPVPS